MLTASLAMLAACGSSAETRDPRVVENSAPAVATVRDGMDADQNRQEQRSALFANWDPFVDPEGQPVVYEWCIGRSPGAADVMPWKFVGGATRAATDGVDLPAGLPLYVSVRATDIAGSRSAVASSNGIVLGPTEHVDAPDVAVRNVKPAPKDPAPEPVSTNAPTRRTVNQNDVAARPEPAPRVETPPATDAPPQPAADTRPKPAPIPIRPATEPTRATNDAPPPHVEVPVTHPDPPAAVPVLPGERPMKLERFGITWTFARPVECGRFVSGDWWIAGPCEIVAIAPASRTDDGRTRHGAMVNPDPRSPRQGYDSAMFGPEAGDRYDATKNVALGVSPERRLRLEPGQSLVCTVSHATPGQMPQLETCAVLTCLRTRPPANAFRPPYCGTDKECRWVADSLDLSRLAHLEVPAGAPTPEDLLPRFERTWLDHVAGWTGRFLHPGENMPDYGRDIADLVGTAALVLQLDHPIEQKRALAIAMAQLGIDLHGIVQAGGRFVADGGSGSGRKFPVLFAGAVLHDRDILRAVREQKLAFAEDVQTFHVEQTSPGVWNRGYGDYGPDDAGLPEWGNQHADDPSFDRKSWNSDPFRRCCTANAWHGFVLATRIMGLTEEWGHPALFDYVDRYMQIEGSGTYQRSWSPFAERMWDAHRAAF